MADGLLHTHKVDEVETPFLLRVFYRVGAFYSAEEFVSSSLPPHVSIHTWPDCTLKDLALELTEVSPPALPSPVYGTRLAFQHVFPDLRRTNSMPNGPPRYGVKDLGSVVVGAGPTADEERWDRSDEDKTLSDARFVVGDYISCAVLPPKDDGSVALVPISRPEPSRSMHDGRGSHRGARSGFRDQRLAHREDGWGGRGGHRSDAMEPVEFPAGEWRRGEQLPRGRPRGGRGRGRW